MKSPSTRHPVISDMLSSDSDDNDKNAKKHHVIDIKASSILENNGNILRNKSKRPKYKTQEKEEDEKHQKSEKSEALHGGILGPSPVDLHFFRFSRAYWIYYSLIAVNVLFVIIEIALLSYESLHDQHLKERAAINFGVMAGIDAFIGILFLSRIKLIQEYIFDSSFNNNMHFHRVLGWFICFNSTMHAVLMMIFGYHDFTTNLVDMQTSGLIAWIAIFLLSMLSFDECRRTSYSFFQFTHISLYIIFIFFGSFHSWLFRIPLLILAVLWIVDMLYTKHRSMYPDYEQSDDVIISKLKVIPPGNIVKVKMYKKGFHHLAGQFLYFRIPDISLAYKPFEIANCPYQSENVPGKGVPIVLYVRADNLENLGCWTTKLKELADKCRESKRNHESNKKRSNKQQNNNNNNKKDKDNNYPIIKSSDIQSYITGPYGYLKVPGRSLYSYQYIMFISGGLGITSTQSLLNDYLHHHIHVAKTPEFIKNIKFVWTCREQGAMVSKYQSKGNLEQLKYMTFQPNIIDYKLIDQLDKQTTNISLDFHITQINLFQAKALSKLPKEPKPTLPTKPDIVTIHTHGSSETIENNNHRNNTIGLNIDETIKEMFLSSQMENANKLAIVCCCPKDMYEKIQSVIRSCKGVQPAIDLHYSSWEF